MFLKNVKNEETPYRTLQMQGANVRLSPFGHEKMPEGQSVKERVVTLIKSAAAYEEREHEKEQVFLQGLLNEQREPVDLSGREKAK
jgi:hypothetical protein